MGGVAANNGGVQQGKKGYGGGGRRREPWWRKTAARKQLRTTLKYISVAERERRCKSGRHGKGRGGTEVVDSESNAGINGPQYDGTATGDNQVGE